MLILIGLAVGFFASLPPGPINIFAISKALRGGFWKSLPVGLTAALLDVIYCYAALIATSLLVSWLDRWSIWLRLAGAAVLVAVSIHLFRQARSLVPQDIHLKRKAARMPAIAWTLIMYVSSPTLLAFWVAVAAAMMSQGLTRHPGSQPALFSISCGAGSFIWYFSVARFGSRLQSVVSGRMFRTILTLLAALLLAIALLAVGRFILEWRGNTPA
jgi:threonine/homoserine/homoserine lactone efflux protein